MVIYVLLKGLFVVVGVIELWFFYEIVIVGGIGLFDNVCGMFIVILIYIKFCCEVLVFCFIG